jgi:hypothetical protein
MSAINNIRSGGVEQRTEEVVEFFLAEYDLISEFRLQKLVYMVDEHAFEEYGGRITDLDWRCYRYGMYADRLKLCCEMVADESTYDILHIDKHPSSSKVVTHYSLSGPAYIDRDVQRICMEVHTLTSERSNYELWKATKNCDRFAVTDFEDVLSWE